MFVPLPNGNIKLIQEFTVYVWVDEGINLRVDVPAGFESDGASIPRLLWPVIGPPMGESHLVPAIVHDYLCTQAKTYPQRVIGDAIFFWLLRKHEVPYWKRSLMYVAVRLFGRFMWSRQHAR